MRHLLRRPALALAVPVVAVIGFASASQANHIQGVGSCQTKAQCAGHEFWPKMTLADVQKASEFGGSTLGGKPGNSDELLGWHGSDNLSGGEEGDVLWADHIGTNQPTTQKDVLSGGEGNDFLYSAAGTNTIDAGPGNDAIKARYGRGTVNCGAGRDIVHIPRSRKPRWKFTNCEKYEYRSESATGRGLKPLP